MNTANKGCPRCGRPWPPPPSEVPAVVMDRLARAFCSRPSELILSPGGCLHIYAPARLQPRRQAWELFHGPLARDQRVLAVKGCLEGRLCLNPAHMRLAHPPDPKLTAAPTGGSRTPMTGCGP